MKNSRLIYCVLLMAFGLTLISLSLKAQDQSDLSAFLKAQSDDASKLIAAYTTPAVKAVSFGMTNGWYHTGKAHNKLGIDVGITFSAVMIPTSDNHFNSSAIGLSPITHQTNTSTFQAPTIFGPKETTTYQSTYKTAQYPAPVTVTFNGPEGLDLKKNVGMSAVPVPMIQLGVGLIKNTDLKVRFLPEQKIGASKVKMLGFGLLHDIKQYMPGIKLAPFDLSVLAAFNTVQGTTDLSNSSTSTNGPPVSPDGKATYKLSSWVAQVIVSKKFSVLTLYAGVGYGSVSTRFNETGNYSYNSSAGPVGPVQVPVTINFDNKGAKITAGMRLKFGPIYLNGDYTLQKYNAITVGLGVSVR
jgi:hypothetical protein